MDRYGGSFVQGLAALYRRADPENRRRLEVAFAATFAEYRATAAQLRRKRDSES